MNPQIDQQEVHEQAIRTCLNCGNQDTDDYCSKCGSKLRFLGDEKDLPLRNLKNILRGYISEILDPIFAYIKTIWLLLFHPITFFRTLYFRDQPIGNITFPLSSLWRKVSGDTPQHVLDPDAFYASNILINIISLAIIIIGLAAQFVAQQFQSDSDLKLFSSGLGSAGFFALFYMLATAFVFDSLTEKDKIPPNYKYSFWVYTFGLIWLLPLLGLLLRIIFLPALLLFKVAGLKLGILEVAISSTTTISSQINSMALEFYNSVVAFFTMLTVSIGAFYNFFIMPFKVFSNIYNEDISTKRLVIVMLVSIISPGLVLCLLCSFPFLLF